MSAQGYFVTGTDTDVGKTVASAVLMHALGAVYWKPVQSGLQGETDTEAVKRLTGLPAERFHAPRFELTQPLSPHESARRDDVSIHLDDFALPEAQRLLVVEGGGGVLVPLNGEAMMADLMKRLGLPVILVARSSLGTINHTLLSLEALRARGIEVAGVIMNGAPNAANRSAIEEFGRMDVLMEIPHLDPLNVQSIAQFAKTNPFHRKATA